MSGKLKDEHSVTSCSERSMSSLVRASIPRRLTSLLSASIAMAILACSSDRTTEPSTELSLDVVAGGRYTIVDLGTLTGPNSSATDLNGVGQVVGWSQIVRSDGSLQNNPFIWKDGVMKDRHVRLRAGPNYPLAINGAGQFVGTKPFGLYYFRAFIWNKGVVTELGVLRGDWYQGCCSKAAGINSAGQVAGTSDLDGDTGVVHPFMWQNGVMTDLGFEGFSTGINDAGLVVGTSYTSGGGFIWSNGSVRFIGNFAPTAINEAIQLAGSISTPTGQRAALWQDGVVRDLGTLGGARSIAYGINDLGQVVGMSLNAAGKERAFLWDGTSMINLGTLGGTASRAYAINRAGRIVGESKTTSGVTHATLWQPNQ
jgi:probable HAF family extracellular repeat protein